jgi:opacity protein-like surface antigen
MRKLITGILLLILLADVSHAQSTEVGILASGNFATFDGNPEGFEDYYFDLEGSSPSFGRRLAGRIGGFVRFGVTQAFAIRQEIAFSQKGTTFASSAPIEYRDAEGNPVGTATIDVDITAQYTYIETPVLAEYTVPTGTQFKPYLTAGPSISFSVSSEEEIKSSAKSESSPDLNSSSTMTEQIDASRVNFGLVVGWGVKYTLGSGDSILLDIRYNPSFTDNQGTERGDLELQNDVLSVGIGYSFSF